MDILGENDQNKYDTIARKVKLLYGTLNSGSVKIGNIMPDMVPFFSGFEMVDDIDTLIHYELPDEFFFEVGGGMSDYKIIISDITINCEKYPSLNDDIDIRNDMFKYIINKFRKFLSGSFDEDDRISFSIRKYRGLTPSKALYHFKLNNNLN